MYQTVTVLAILGQDLLVDTVESRGAGEPRGNLAQVKQGPHFRTIDNAIIQLELVNATDKTLPYGDLLTIGYPSTSTKNRMPSN